MTGAHVAAELFFVGALLVAVRVLYQSVKRSFGHFLDALEEQDQ